MAAQGVQIRGYMSQLGPIKIEFKQWESVGQNAFFCPDPERVAELEAYMDQLRRDQDSVGAEITVIAEGVPVGLGEPVFDRLDADLAHGLMSINAVKGVEIGAGFGCVAQRGSEHRDEMTPEGFLQSCRWRIRRYLQRPAHCGSLGAKTDIQYHHAGSLY
ncbi:hypothetical protein HORIV_44990 [Vreelandella olivaria]|uniref:chorismate synthase n=1 Tax=Vreelandella olivaria TaxID=390919 RepID=A0ABM7GN42_9GAMM|nr:hypothetical protein HORIV_44990 [Halomonas olivaria]